VMFRIYLEPQADCTICVASNKTVSLARRMDRTVIPRLVFSFPSLLASHTYAPLLHCRRSQGRSEKGFLVLNFEQQLLISVVTLVFFPGIADALTNIVIYRILCHLKR
jgi:hypothetical protein